ncbi:hypothetical protein BGZ58_009673 [Dissophora ornata]|nr:hypothetical protein BGZ58_009673 [Dissophora ornata]
MEKEKLGGQQKQELYGLQNDPYRRALRTLAKEKNVEITVDNLAPLTTVFPESTVLSRAILGGYPSTQFPHPQHINSSEYAGNSLSSSSMPSVTKKRKIWAFAVTSQNAVHAVEEALQKQTDSAIREAWLQIPIFCLTGATLASVKLAGFKTINYPGPFTLKSSDQPRSSFSSTTADTPSFDNGAQLVDFLVSLEWPAAIGAETEAPELWFLTGETRMKTLAETLTAHQKPFQEIIVYETGPRPNYEHEVLRWLTDSGTSANALGTGGKKRRVLWLVGFSPRGIDITIPALKRFLEEVNDGQQQLCERNVTEVRWAAIGQTTAKRIQEHLETILGQMPVQSDDVILDKTVTVAKAPKPDAVAEAILSRE